jgi:hypothetical protein
MGKDDEFPLIRVRVPGRWRGWSDLAGRLSSGYRAEMEDGGCLYTPDGMRLPLSLMPKDGEFVEIFASGCSREPSDADKYGIERYRHNAYLIMPGGSFERAAAALRYTVVLLDAGGHGVFVDNSGIAHGSDDWRDLARDSGPDGGGPFWAFVVSTGMDGELLTTGMHCMGFRDAVMPRTGDDRADDFQIRNFLSYAYRSGAVIEEGHVVAANLAASPEDPVQAVPMFNVHLEEDTLVAAGHPMHNPYGRYRLIPYKQGPTLTAN